LLVNEAEVTQALENSEATEQTEQPIEQQQLFDLDSADKFRWQGKEWSKDSFKEHLDKSTLMQSDYTKKTQELAKKEKFYRALPSDLEAVRQNPALADEFMRIYPKSFHHYVQGIKPAQPDQSQAHKPTTDPRLESRLEQIERSFRERETESILAKLDTMFSGLSQKYPDVDEEVVLAKAQTLLDRKQSAASESGEEGPVDISQNEWDALWKSEQDKFEKRFKEKSSSQFKAQKDASKRARDVGPGGGVPARGMPQARNIKEATALALKELE
jgi:hypothetical protein